MEASSSAESGTAGGPDASGLSRGGRGSATGSGIAGRADVVTGMRVIALAAPVAKGRRSLLRHPTLEFLGAGLVAMLAVESLLGTYLSMFVEIPANGAIESLPLDGLAVLTVHILVGIALIILTARMILVATRSKNGRGLVVSGIAFVGVVLAFVGGSLFTSSGQDEGMSFIMASGTFVAMFCAAILIASTAAARGAPRPEPA